jgi:IS30 family transposase
VAQTSSALVRVVLPGPLLRQYFPKGTDFSSVTEAELDAVPDELNARPRKRLSFANPREQLAELLLQ